jgi:alpha-maltose-1-phosphate synthase
VIGVDAMGLKDTVVHGKTGFLAKVGETIELEEEWAYTSMGFEENHKIKFDSPKTFAVRAEINDLAECLLKLLSEDDLALKMGEEGRKHAVDNFDYKKISLDVAELIEKKLGL